jgi:DEAD/DEAH box helicase domain-containing protein
MEAGSLGLPESWTHRDTKTYAGRDPVHGEIEVISSESVKRHLAAGPRLYKHQVDALEAYVSGKDVCLSTGTASGKTVLFHGAHVHSRVERPRSATLALYPMKALGIEQTARWKAAFKDQIVGRIDGDVQGADRERILRTSDILICTPDVWHASLLAKANEPSAAKFLSRLGLIAIDEAHTYSGVFGSNSAFLIRRLQYAACLLSGKDVGFVAASATLKNAAEHMRSLVGVDFHVIGPDSDGSPRQPMAHHFIQPASNVDLMKALPDLLSTLVRNGKRFLAFVDSRKQVELITDILNRGHGQEDDEEVGGDILERFGVLPYRSGYESHDRQRIQERLRDPKLHGIVSTSAMELGLDIPNLDAVVLIGVPSSATSLHQRIGRVGRNKPGEVWVVYTGSLIDQYVWEDTDRFLSRPLQESTLYLANRRIQYIHAMCLARPGGENETLTGSADEAVRNDLAVWPDGFIALCEEERTGQINAEMEAMKGEAGDEPHRRFPLRSCESQFRVLAGTIGLGQLSYSQALREAYPGGVYRHLMEAYRVYKVSISSKEILVRKEKRYTTTPSPIPVKVMPNVQAGRLRRAIGMGEATILECDAQIREAVCGFKERRGPSEFSVTYPKIEHVSGVTWPHPMFSNQFGSSALVLFHPALDADKVEMTSLADLLYEALLLAQPFERNDLGKAGGRLAVAFRDLKGCRFLSIFDSTNGSLRLSSRFLEGSILEDALSILGDLADGQELREESLRAVELLAQSSRTKRVDLLLPEPVDSSEKVELILESSFGWSLPHGRQEYVVDGYFVHPKDGLKYRGHLRSWEKSRDPLAKVQLPISAVEIVPGESKTGWYDFETGETTPIEVSADSL